MTKYQLVNTISRSTGVERMEVLKVVEVFMDSVKESVSNGESVFLRGFGTFQRIERAAKIARNIKAGTSLPLAAHNIPKFKPCKEFKEQVK